MAAQTGDTGDDGGPAYWRVAIVEDHRLQRKRTEQLVNSQAGLRVVFGCEAAPDLLVWLARLKKREYPHLVILDLVADRGPRVEPEQVRMLVDRGIRVLVLSALASPAQVRAVLRAGVGGVVGKRDDETDIVNAIWAVLRREHWVTPELASMVASDSSRPKFSDQEERALILYASGLTLAAVATALGVKPETARSYLTRVKTKYAAAGRPARTKVELGREAALDGLVDPFGAPQEAFETVDVVHDPRDRGHGTNRRDDSGPAGA